MKLSVFISVLLAEILSAVVFVNYAIYSSSDLWMLCIAVFVIGLPVQYGILTKK